MLMTREWKCVILLSSQGGPGVKAPLCKHFALQNGAFCRSNLKGDEPFESP